MSLPADFVFTQGNMQDWLDCPRRFELRHILRQRWPAAEVDDLDGLERRAQQGAAFHLLVQQYLAGVPAAALTARITDPDLAAWFRAWRDNGLADVPDRRWPELRLTAPLGRWTLLVQFDLLAITPDGRALILDWKTGSRLPPAAWLERRAQTIAYRYVLAQAGAALNGGAPFAPEDITLRYWYAQHGGATREFGYSATRLRADRAWLLAQTRAIDACQGFALTEETRRCRFCVYRSLCGRGEKPGPLAEWDGEEELALPGEALELDRLDEVAF